MLLQTLCSWGFTTPTWIIPDVPTYFTSQAGVPEQECQLTSKIVNYGKNCGFDFWDLLNLNYFWGHLWNIIELEITISNDDIRFISGRNPLINPLFSRIVAIFWAPIFGYHNIYTFDPSFALCQFEKLAWSLIHQLLKKWCR